jgi:hypothetical protein
MGAEIRCSLAYAEPQCASPSAPSWHLSVQSSRLRATCTFTYGFDLYTQTHRTGSRLGVRRHRLEHAAGPLEGGVHARHHVEQQHRLAPRGVHLRPRHLHRHVRLVSNTCTQCAVPPPPTACAQQHTGLAPDALSVQQSVGRGRAGQGAMALASSRRRPSRKPEIVPKRPWNQMWKQSSSTDVWRSASRWRAATSVFAATASSSSMPSCTQRPISWRSIVSISCPDVP